MSVAVDVSSDGARSPIGRARVADIVRGVLAAERVGEAMISVAFVSRRAIARLNREHLGHSGATDVISFGFAPDRAGGPVVGDIYICPDVARANASEHGSGVREEVARLVVHGALHVLGHDHPEGADRDSSPMWRTQERLLARLLTRPL